MLALVLAPALAAPASACTPHRPAACVDTNALIIQAGFARALRAYAGPGRASWLYPDGRVADQVIDVLHGPPDAPVVLGPDLVRLSACRAHSCTEKGAAFLTTAGRIQAVAVLDFHCTKRCEDAYTLEVITRDPARFTPLARAWGEAVIAADLKSYGPMPGQVNRIDRVETRTPAP